MDTRTPYYLLLIDLKDSTRLGDPRSADVYEALEAELAELNEVFRVDCLIGLSINYGDEIAGLFSCPSSFHSIVIALRRCLFPDLRFRFVAQRGKIARSSPDIRKIGGKIFKDAEIAMVNLKKEKRFCYWGLGNRALDLTLRAVTEFANDTYESMTDYQRTVFELYERGIEQKAIARELGKYPQSVSTAVRRGRADLLKDAYRALDLVLGEHTTIMRCLEGNNRK